MNNDLNSDKAPPPNSSRQRYGPFVAGFALLSGLGVFLIAVISPGLLVADVPLVEGCDHPTAFRAILQKYLSEVGSCVGEQEESNYTVSQKTTEGEISFIAIGSGAPTLIFESADGEHFSFYGCDGTGAPEDCRMLPGRRFNSP